MRNRFLDQRCVGLSRVQGSGLPRRVLRLLRFRGLPGRPEHRP